jgi:alkanesulfonate monooxygenase SsuD/methylene tetrahydromethanopterin reductase-like flavin-dependent oxidoreductase (luciferase family)
VAARTRRLRLGVAISVLPFHDPLRIAEDYAVVDVISGGRLEFGVGRGYQPKEFKGFNIDMAEARGRFLESLDIIQQAWTGEPFSYDGKYYKVRDLAIRPKPVQDPIPVYVASVSPETFELARQRGFSIMGALLTNSAEQLSQQMPKHRAALSDAERWRRPMPIMTPMYVGSTNEEALRDTAAECAWYYRTVGKLLPGQGEAMDPSYAYFRKLAERTGVGDVAQTVARWPIGDADRVSEFIIDLCRRTTADHIICFASIGAMEYRKALANIERIATKVMPRVRAALATDNRTVVHA